MTEPTFDADGYPTQETLDALIDWPYKDALGALRFMQAAWHWPERVTETLRVEELLVCGTVEGDVRFLRCSTGGWSGNEDLIFALRDNPMIWSQTWRMSTSGGLHIFRLPPP